MKHRSRTWTKKDRESQFQRSEVSTDGRISFTVWHPGMGTNKHTAKANFSAFVIRRVFLDYHEGDAVVVILRRGVWQTLFGS